MGIWNKFFGAKKPEKSPYFPDSEGPLDLGFVKKFTSFGGFFLYNDSSELVLKNFKEICTENNLYQVVIYIYF